MIKYILYVKADSEGEGALWHGSASSVTGAMRGFFRNQGYPFTYDGDPDSKDIGN